MRLALSFVFAVVLALIPLTVFGQSNSNPDSISLDAKGVVTDQIGKPIGGATVELVKRRYRAKFDGFLGVESVASATTAADGSYHLAATIPAADWIKYSLRTVAPGYAYSAIGIEPDQSPVRYFDFLRQTRTPIPWIILLPEQHIRGVVVDDQDEPVADCQISQHQSRDVVCTAKDGRFDLDRVPDFADSLLTHVNTILFEQANLVQREVDVSADRLDLIQPDGTWRVKLEHGVLLTGTMRDEATEQPVSGARFRASADVGGINPFSANAVSDSQGHYSVRLPVTKQIVFDSFHGGDDQSNFEGIREEVREDFSNVNDAVEKDFLFRRVVKTTRASPSPPAVPATQATPLHGKVIHANGTPVRLASLRLLPRDGAQVGTRLFTDLEGNFQDDKSLANVAGTIYACDPTRDEAGVLELSEEADPGVALEIKLTTTSTLTGRVCDEQGNPCPHMRVYVMEIGNLTRTNVIATECDDQGQYRLRGFVLPEKGHRFEVQARPRIQSNHGLQVAGHDVTAIKPREEQGGLNFRIITEGQKDIVEAERE